MKLAAGCRRNLASTMEDAAEKTTDGPMYTTPGANEDPHISQSTRNKKSANAFDATVIRDAAIAANKEREANEERRHKQNAAALAEAQCTANEHKRKRNEQQASYQTEALAIKKMKMEADQRQGAEVTALKVDINNLKHTVGALTNVVHKQGEKQEENMAELKALPPGLRGWEFCTICPFFANFSTFTKIPQVPSFQAHSPVKTVFRQNPKNARKSQNTPSTNPYQNETQFPLSSLKNATSGHARPPKSVLCPPVISGTNSRQNSLKFP